LRILVLGLGNLVHSDDGVGVHAIRRLQKDERVPRGIELLDGGTQGISLLPHVSGCDCLLVLDAIDASEPPGTVLRLPGSALEGLPGKPSAHQLGVADLFVVMKLLQEVPPELMILGVQPSSTAWSSELSPQVEEAMPDLINLAIAQMKFWQLPK
jgi:hydrogenase maturation protease